MPPFAWGKDRVHPRRLPVALMSEIYRRASVVYVWLGETDERVYKGAILPEELATLADQHIPEAHEQEKIKMQLLVLLRDASRTEQWAALSSLFYRQWWHRSWIIQEITFAKHAVILCGSLRFRWSLLEKLNKIRA